MRCGSCIQRCPTRSVYGPLAAVSDQFAHSGGELRQHEIGAAMVAGLTGIEEKRRRLDVAMARAKKSPHLILP